MQVCSPKADMFNEHLLLGTKAREMQKPFSFHSASNLPCYPKQTVSHYGSGPQRHGPAMCSNFSTEQVPL